ncbi:HAMP domain-containing histidine kinase [Myxococcus sp. CA051A]|uniref:HAMP domain-containing sensor histidine kinase n=1 Tax=Myxococcus sp. CA051A TaxID=2741739 RepID=UPI00157A3206|nr:HAMP domain-containing sensor histidine kinase [Myxococcus sp. CA051A]NTX64354.1 HAMP domain-containing histidine kinase [Myxococcus sp. CA051A]
MKLGERLRPRRMFWRIYLYGLLMLGGAVVSFAVIASLVESQIVGQDTEKTYERLVELAAAESPELAPLMESLAAQGKLRATLYDLQGTVKASSARPPLRVLDDAEWRELRTGKSWFKRDGQNHWATPTWRGNTVVGYLLHEANNRRTYTVLGGVLALVLVVLAGLSVPLAWALASPLERLTKVVGEFGQGRLSARVRLKGRNEVAVLGHTFDTMAERTESLIRGQKELLANVSHELRTPLARLGVTLDLVEDGQPEELAARLPELRRDIGELQQLVDGVLQMARLDLEANQAGQPGPRLQRATLRLTEFLKDAAERFQKSAPECRLQLDVAENLPTLEADPVLVRRALHNLLDNARKYSEPGSPVTLRAQVDAQAVHLDVEDRGIGISDEDLPKLTTPFFRTDRSRARETGGTGLGLTLVRRIVEAHGGTLSLQGVTEGGIRARLVLPLTTT